MRRHHKPHKNKTMTVIIAHSEHETEQAAITLAAELQPGAVLCLYGDLGAGKTVFARALIRYLTGDPALTVPSPTFTLVQTYDTKRGTIWHFDLYRIEHADDIYELGWEDALADSITIVEWPERLESLAPEHCLRVDFKAFPDEPDKREINISQQNE